MEAVYKSGGTAQSTDGDGALPLDRPSIISLKIAPEKVAKYERRGEDLVLVLRDGQEVVVRHFFTPYPDDGRNDLVLEDDAGVLWWGQYHGPWTEFHFTEIEWNVEVPIPLWLVTGLSVLGLGSALGGGGGGGGNRPPEAPSYKHTIDEDHSVSGRVVGRDPNGDPLTYTTGTPPGHGTVVLNPDGSYTYTPDPNYHGPDSFTVIVDDGKGGTTTSTVTIDVTPVNDDPTAPDYDQTTPEDTPISGRVTGSDVDGDPLTYTAGTPPSHGTVVVNPDGTYTYTPDPDYHGPDSFTVIVDDGNGGTTTSTVTITVTPVNDPVYAVDDSFTVAEDTPLVLDLLGNDKAPDGGLHITSINGTPLTPGVAQSIDITDDGTPTGTVIGQVEIDAGGTITFVPAPNYNGPVSFDYEIEDGDGDTDTATVSITVTPDAPPSIVPVDGNGGGTTSIEQGHATVYESGLPGGSGGGATKATGTITIEAGDGVKSVTIGGTTILLADLENAGTTPVVITTPHGELTITGYTPNGTDFNGISTGGTIHYEYELLTPEANTPGSDNFIDDIPVSIDDGGGSSTSGSLQINIVDDAPKAQDDAVTTTSAGSAGGNVIDGTITTGTGTGGGIDAPGADGPITVTGIGSDNMPGNTPSGTGTLTIHGEYGTLTIQPDGSYTYARDTNTPGGAKDIFTYTVTDGDGDSRTAQLTVTLYDDAPELTVTPVDPLNPPTGLPPGLPPGIFDIDPADPSLGRVSAVVYEGALDSTGSNPGSAAETATGSFTFSSPDGVKSLLVGGTNIVGATFPVTITTPLGSTLTITGYTYDPATGQGTVNYSYELKTGETHTQAGNDSLDDTIAIVLTDLDDTPVSGNIVVRIIDDTPTTVNDTNSVTEGGTLSVTTVADGVLGNDKAGADGWASGGGVVGATKGSGGTATENASNGSIVIQGDYGVLTLHADGTYTYVSTADSTTVDAQDVFTYTVKDGDGDLSTATLTIDVANVTGTGQATTGTVNEKGLSNGTDPGNGHEITGSLNLPAGWTPSGTLTGTTTNGSWTIFKDTDGTWKYTFTLTSSTTDINQAATPETNSFTFTTQDGKGNTATGNTVTVTIVDDEPQITTSTTTPGAVTVDETTLGTPSGWVAFADLFNAPVYGADGAAATNPLVYTLEVGNAATGLVDVATGNAITLVLNTINGNLEGRVAGNNDLAFTIQVDSDGRVQLTQQRAISHGDTDNPDDSASLPAGSVVLRATVTDGDGDSTSAVVNVGGSFTFKDDGPTIGSPVNGTVEEKYLPTGSDAPATPTPVQATGSLGVSFGNDGAGDVVFTSTGTVNTISQLQAMVLTSGGTPLVYALSDNGHTLTATANGVQVFTVVITNPASANPGYTFTLLNGLDNPGGADLTPDFLFRVTDRDGDHTEKTFTITVKDDEPVTTRDVTVAEDGQVTFNTSADGNGSNVTAPAKGQTDGPAHGTVTVNPDGTVTYKPDGNYSGGDSFTYTTTADDGSQVTTTVTVDVTPVSDAPGMDAGKTVTTNEDVSVSLGLKVPTITDGTDQNGAGTAGDDPERLGAITLTIGGSGASGVTLSTGATVLTPVGGKITIVISDEPHIRSVPAADPANGVYHLTKAEYIALQANPTPESGNNFIVTVSATSYEVDDTGAVRSGVAGATSTQVISVDVQAVTDGASLTWTPTGTDVTFAEDTTLDLSGFLTAAQTSTDANPGNDTDGSETYWYTISGLPQGTVVSINGANYTAGADGTVTSATSSTFTAAPSITVKPPADYSGDIGDVKITLHTRDTDADSSGTIAEVTSEVTLSLHVSPVAGDWAVDNPAATPEDTPIAFLAGVHVTDTGAGSEVINVVSFTVPTGWTVTEPASSAGWSYGLSGTTATITFNDDPGAGTVLTEAQREAILDAFTITPPAHSSKDATISLTVTTTDTNTVNGAPLSNTVTNSKDVTITVTPVAERADSDSNHDSPAHNDVTLHGDEAYAVHGKEDEWFALGTTYAGASNATGGFALASGWSNEDTDEFTYAVLTPTLSSSAPGDTVMGTQFRFSTDGGATWETRTYNGEAVWVPAQYLNTLQVKLPPDVSGTLTIGVQAGTVDYDDDAATEVSTLPLDPPTTSGNGVSVAVSGNATLTLVTFDPVADAVTLALNGHANGLEDTPILLAIKATSSDPSETIDLTISAIPAGAVLTYNGAPVTVTGGVATITGFDHTKPLTITPPPNSNNDFTLHVSAVSVDGSDRSTPTPARDIEVSVKGVADEPVVTLASPQTYTEADLDGGAKTVKLSDLVSNVTSPDSDGSEAVSVRITGLAEGFTLTGATLVTSGTGAERVWTVPVGQMSSVEVKVPANYSGTVAFQVAGVTTENDGDSRTGVMGPVSFTVTPSAEGTASESVALVEDIRAPLGLSIVYAGGDTDEHLGKVWIQADQVSTTNYTLYLNGTALSSLPTTNIGGVNYVEIAATDVPNLQVQGGANLDGNLGSFNFRYEVIDDHYGSTSTGSDTVIKDGTFVITAKAVTDPVHLNIADIDGSATDTTLVTAAGTVVTVNLHVNSDDTDGSEHLIRVLIEGVPDGVTVVNGAQTGPTTWVLVYDGAAAKAIGTGGLDLPVEFIVGVDAGTGSLVDHRITMTVQAQDRGDQATPGTEIEADSATWHLQIDLANGPGYTPPHIDEWAYNGAKATEDTAFHLSDVISGKVTIETPGQPNTLTVTLTDVPAGTIISGMVLTSVNGVPTWTASVTVPLNGDGQAALNSLLSGITITPPADYNDNTGGFDFNASLHTSAAGGHYDNATTAMPVPVTPVTDEAVITVNATNMNEGDANVQVAITVSDPKDGTHGHIVDGKLYVQVDAPGNAGGTLSQGGTALTQTAVTGVPGVPNGNYYVIDVGTGGGSVNLVYTPPAGNSLQPGSVTVNAYAQTQETDAANTVAGHGSGASAIAIINNGVTVGGNTGWTGGEADTPNASKAIVLTSLSVALNDNDGSETVNAILLSGVPVGFLVYVNGVLANNAGGDAVSNTWVLSSNGTLPTVSILPPAHWSGTLTGLQLVVESGETALAGKLTENIPLAALVVTPVADGLSIAPTNSFGKEGTVIDLNLNAKMEDPVGAVSAVADASRETTTLQFTGLGEHAAFYVGSALIDAARVSYAGGVYTITGLTQDELDKLGFVQAESALVDQDAGQSGVQIGVTAWTVESSNGAQSAHVSGTLDLQVSKVAGTTGADSLIWGGSGKAVIDGRAGDDTVALRLGEDVSGHDLGLGLKNIEKLDLSVAGANKVTDLTLDDVLKITDSNHTLTILGDGQDSVSLGAGWTAGTSTGGYTAYTGSVGGNLVKVLIDDHIHVL